MRRTKPFIIVTVMPITYAVIALYLWKSAGAYDEREGEYARAYEERTRGDVSDYQQG